MHLIRRRGFVLAMHAKLISAAPLPAQFEWVIVSRWGAEGEYLALGWTMMPALSGESPTQLVPRRTSLACAAGPGEMGDRASFELASSLGEITVAGDFVPAKGYVRLFSKGSNLQMISKGKSLRPDLHPSWQLQGVRKPWFGEFIESGDTFEAIQRDAFRTGHYTK
jgi:hypothetical protein